MMSDGPNLTMVYFFNHLNLADCVNSDQTLVFFVTQSGHPPGKYRGEIRTPDVCTDGFIA